MSRLASGRLRLIAGFLFAGLFLWLLTSKISLNEVIAAIAQAKPGMLVAALAAFGIGYACRVERWRLLLVHDNPDLGWRSCFRPFMASVAANNVLPLRAGDLLRAVGFSSALKVRTATTITSLVMERLLDLLTLLVLTGICLAFFHLDSSRLLGIGSAPLVLSGLCIVFALFFPGIFVRAFTYLARALGRPFPRISSSLLPQLEKVSSLLLHLSSGEQMGKLLFWSFLAWTAEGLLFYLAALALPSIVRPAAAWIALLVGTLATIVPSSPGYVGTFDFFVARAMVAFAGNSLAAAAAYAFLVHVLLWAPATLVGGVYLLTGSTSKGVKQAKAVWA